MAVIHRLARWLRVGLRSAVGWIFPVAHKPVTLPAHPTLLVMRLDKRLGNLVLLTPLLESLRKRFPTAQLHVGVHPCMAAVLTHHPASLILWPCARPRWGSWLQSLRLLKRLRAQRYDLCIDASNPTDPSTTQALWVRCVGACHTVGSHQPGLGRLFTAPVSIFSSDRHEIDLRLSLLKAVPGWAVVRRTSLGLLEGSLGSSLGESLESPHRGSDFENFLDSLARPFGVINIGARLPAKRLPRDVYDMLAHLVKESGWQPVFTYGPSEATLAHPIQRACPEAVLAPPTTLSELSRVLAQAQGAISCDTGPMHMAVALGTPTCGIFVSTDPMRFGYSAAPHACIDARGFPPEAWLPQVRRWLGQRRPRGPQLD